MLPRFLRVPPVIKKAQPQEERLALGGGWEVDVKFRRNPRAKRVILRLVPFEEAVVLVLPRGIDKPEGLSFLMEKADWVISKFEERLAPVPFEDGAVVPFKDEEITIVHRGDLRGACLQDSITGRDLLMGGQEAHLSRRVGDWFKARAREDLSSHSRSMAEQLGKSVARVTLRDTKTRWGSCSPQGNLSFSWRLILAPSAVLRYVAAHEVSHLVVPNHSPAFWAVVDGLVGAAEDEKDWLRLNGRSLHRYGV